MSNEPTTPATPATPVTPAAAPAAPPQPPTAETITLSKADWDRLNGTLGSLQEKERQRAAEQKKADDEEAKKRGEHEKLLGERDKEIESLKPWQQKYAARVKADHDRRIVAVAKCDDKIKAQFKAAEQGKELSLAEMEANLAKLDEYEALGLLQPKAPNGDGTVVVPAGGQQAVTVKAGDPPRAFDPWKT